LRDLRFGKRRIVLRTVYGFLSVDSTAETGREKPGFSEKPGFWLRKSPPIGTIFPRYSPDVGDPNVRFLFAL